MQAYINNKVDKPNYVITIPQHWKKIGLKHLINLRSGSTPPTDKNNIAGKYLVFGANGVIGYSASANIFVKSILIGRVGASGAINFSDNECWVSDNALIVEIKKDILFQYAYYLLVALNLPEMAQKNAQPLITGSLIRSLNVILPPKVTQQIISDYLDRKTKQIDTLITKKKHQVELLQEQRTVFINQVVTKGLNPSITMKDSGIEWLGEIPSHWTVKRIKHIVQRKKNAIKTGPFGSQLTNADMMGDEVKVYNQRSVIDNDFDEGDYYISIEKFQQLREFEIFTGDILITTRGTIGRCAIFPDNAEKGILHPCLIRLQLNDELMLKEYLIWFIQDSALFQHSIFFESNATTIDVIYSGTMKQVVVPVPPIEEQRKIIGYLTEINNKLQQAKQNLEKQIELLQEYRMALISDAVTGKIDVRGEQ